MEGTTQFSVKADQENFIVAYPTAVGEHALWNCTLFPSATADDVGFLRELTKELSADYTIDSNRIFCAGLSGGALMSELMASVAPDLVAAVGVCEGYANCTTTSGQNVQLPNPTKTGVSVIHFHGKKDKVQPFNGGPSVYTAGVLIGSVPQTTQFWVKAEGCNPQGTKQMINGGQVIRWDFHPGSPGGAEYVLFAITNGTHEWATQANLGLSATDHFWHFFSQHPKH
jgi:poly(3-hydroxybutyrate) depolymerase